jgi:lipoate-protein ligase A
VVDLGTVPALRSQAVFHGVARAMDRDTPDTLLLVSPATPYVCVGFHQEVDKEVDVEFCRRRGIPVVRREVGGGAVYLDGGQLFWHVVVHRSRAPALVEDVYRRFLAGPVAAYRAMGIPARHRPVNDIQVEGRKIGGTGAASIGEATVVVGSLIFDFDYELMARVLRVPSEKYRDKVYQGLNAYLTTIRRELGERAPSREEGRRLLIEGFASTLGAQVEFGSLSEREEQAVAEAEARLGSEAWTFQGGGLPRRGVKIAEGVRVAEAAHKAPGGLIRVTLRLRDDAVDDLTLSGDFFFHPPGRLRDLEAALRGAPLDGEALAGRVRGFFARHGVQAPGVGPEDLARAILRARDGEAEGEGER